MIKIDPPRITGASLQEQVHQLTAYLRNLAEQFNIDLNAELDGLRQQKEG